MSKCVYLDNNGTCIPPQRVIDEMVKWTTRGNASSKYPSANSSKVMMDLFREEIAEKNNFNLIGKDGYTVIFTSGGSESNSFVISSSIRSYIKLTNKRPHLIISSIEHDNIMILADDYEEEGVDITRINPESNGKNIGKIDVNKIKKSIRPNTCLISIMHANNETGIINDIKSIGHLAEEFRIPFHTDAVQTFGKFGLDVHNNKITAFSSSFHKLHGPTGTGVVVIKNSFLDGYKLKPMITGHQNYGLRGGTECIHNIAGAREAYKMTFENRQKKNKRILELKILLLNILSKQFDIFFIDEFNKNIKQPSLILISPKSFDNVVPNTILLSVYKKNICNGEMREKLADNKIYISIGSACKTGDKKSSHVLSSLDIPKELIPGVIRISLSDFTEKEDIEVFADKFIYLILSNQCIKKL